jgi:hypothetical protein
MNRITGGTALLAVYVAVLLLFSPTAMAGRSLRSAPLRDLASAPQGAPVGTGVIRGRVLDYAGAPVPGADVLWLIQRTDGNVPMTGAKTDAAGTYEITRVPALAGIGQLWMWPHGSDDVNYMYRGLTFLDPGPNVFDFRPGRFPLTIQRGGPWARGASPLVQLFGSSAVAPVLETYQYLTSASAYAYASPGEYSAAVVSFHSGYPTRRSEAVEIPMPEGAPTVVEAGRTSEVSLTASERGAVRAEVTRWASGAAGSRVVLQLSNVRSGDVYKITGQSMNGREPVRSFGTVTVPSPAPSPLPVPLRVPVGVPKGDKYNFEAARVGSNLDLVASYQVCAFKASRHSIRRGESVRLSGRVPLIPDDSTWNAKMTLTLFKHAGSVGQPWTWQAKGWTKVTTIRTDFMHGGRFSTASLHPRRTTSYVIRFPRSSDPSWRGFTSVETVHVR